MGSQVLPECALRIPLVKAVRLIFSWANGRCHQAGPSGECPPQHFLEFGDDGDGTHASGWAPFRKPLQEHPSLPWHKNPSGAVAAAAVPRLEVQAHRLGTDGLMFEQAKYFLGS